MYAPAETFGWVALGLLLAGLVFIAAFLSLLKTVFQRRPHLTARFQFPASKLRGSGAAYQLAPSLLTPTEAKFYAVLREAVGPLALIQCKVRLADILVAAPRDFGAFRRVSQKHVDFVLCQAGTLRPLVAVELDDRSHEQEDRRRRDAFVDAAYASAKLPVVHVLVQSSYNAAELLAQIQPHLIVDG